MINGEAIVSYRLKFDNASNNRIEEMIKDLGDILAIIKNKPVYKEVYDTLYKAQVTLVMNIMNCEMEEAMNEGWIK